ncbi:hypothetical protein FFLO_01062 [Filobasidium floriforme]|uniref:Stress-response A/B barrel domain-containing protein n=1 Tax=Filobasidium floriforme TaxID=5210 RepID=A0A8K0NSQ6_9TREE|nr:hypothetical protein FFLO_01062 [Filobasidium floriforme]
MLPRILTTAAITTTLLRQTIKKMAPVTHIVGFRFKPTVSEEDKQRLIREMVGLGKNCVKEDGKPYILSLTGGPQSSPEKAFATPHDLVFHVLFASAADRDYYLEKDQAHKKFGGETAAKLLDGENGGVVVLDFEHVLEG